MILCRVGRIEAHRSANLGARRREPGVSDKLPYHVQNFPLPRGQLFHQWETEYAAVVPAALDALMLAGGAILPSFARRASIAKRERWCSVASSWTCLPASNAFASAWSSSADQGLPALC